MTGQLFQLVGKRMMQGTVLELQGIMVDSPGFRLESNDPAREIQNQMDYLI